MGVASPSGKKAPFTSSRKTAIIWEVRRQNRSHNYLKCKNPQIKQRITLNQTTSARPPGQSLRVNSDFVYYFF